MSFGEGSFQNICSKAGRSLGPPDAVPPGLRRLRHHDDEGLEPLSLSPSGLRGLAGKLWLSRGSVVRHAKDIIRLATARSGSIDARSS